MHPLHQVTVVIIYTQKEFAMAVRISLDRQTGFECEIIEPLPQDTQAECPICKCVLREPRKVTCCGMNFCRPCIDQSQLLKKSCPICNQQTFYIYLNNNLKLLLLSFRVHCKKESCCWTGELRELDKHLNEKPIQGEQFVGCEFADVECSDCGKSVKRQQLKAHQRAYHPTCCKYCKNYKSDYEDIVRNHWPTCEFYPVSCPNECGESTQRRYLNDHVSNSCQHTVVNCDFQYVGCKVQLQRKDIPAHNTKYAVSHISLLAQDAEKRGELRKENQILKDQVDKTQAELARMSAAIERSNKEVSELQTIQDQAIKPKLSEHQQQLVELRNEVKALQKQHRSSQKQQFTEKAVKYRSKLEETTKKSSEERQRIIESQMEQHKQPFEKETTEAPKGQWRWGMFIMFVVIIHLFILIMCIGFLFFCHVLVKSLREGLLLTGCILISLFCTV